MKMDKKGIFMSVIGIIVVMLFVLFYNSRLSEKSHEELLLVSKNHFIQSDEFFENFINNYAPIAIRRISKEAMINLSKYNVSGAIKITNLSKNLTDAMINGRIGGIQIVGEYNTLPATIDEIHNLTFHNEMKIIDYNWTLNSIRIEQLDWRNISISFEMFYFLNNSGIVMSKIFNGTVVITNYKMSTSYGTIRPDWIENASLPCFLYTMDNNINCNSINGVSHP